MNIKIPQRIAYYNDFDDTNGNILRALIEDEVITDGVVSTRSITTIPSDILSSYKRVHLFAGIAGWDYALQLAG